MLILTRHVNESIKIGINGDITVVVLGENINFIQVIGGIIVVTAIMIDSLTATN